MVLSSELLVLSSKDIEHLTDDPKNGELSHLLHILSLYLCLSTYMRVYEQLYLPHTSLPLSAGSSPEVVCILGFQAIPIVMAFNVSKNSYVTWNISPHMQAVMVHCAMNYVNLSSPEVWPQKRADIAGRRFFVQLRVWTRVFQRLRYIQTTVLPTLASTQIMMLDCSIEVDLKNYPAL